MTMDHLFPPPRPLEGRIFPILEISESAHTANEVGTTEVPPAAHNKQDKKDGSPISADYVFVLVGAAFSMLSIFFGIVLVLLSVSR
jgi:hypothetical protein